MLKSAVEMVMEGVLADGSGSHANEEDEGGAGAPAPAESGAPAAEGGGGGGGGAQASVEGGGSSGTNELIGILQQGQTTLRLVAALKSAPSVRTASQIRLIGRVVSGCNFFMTLDPSNLEQISRCIKYQSVHPNTVLMQTGDEADKFYLVLKGSLQVLINGVVVAVKGPGDHFGEMALLSSGEMALPERRSADVIAMSSCDLAILFRHDYLDILQQKQNAKMALKLELIKNNPHFSCLSANQQDAFAKCGKLASYRGGQTIIAQGTPAEEIYILARGEVEVVRNMDAEEPDHSQLDVRAHQSATGGGVDLRGGARGWTYGSTPAKGPPLRRDGRPARRPAHRLRHRARRVRGIRRATHRADALLL